MEAPPILPSSLDLERRRLESNIDQDLHSLSLGSLITTTTNSQSTAKDPHATASFSSMSSVEYVRGFGEGYTGQPSPLAAAFADFRRDQGPTGTPRAGVRKVSGMSTRSELDSPVSTAGHHVSAVTLGEGIFRAGRRGVIDSDLESGDEFDPERSLGRLVGELGKVMNGRISPRPTSPFAALSPPRSPSPFSSINNQHGQNLSLTLNRNDPLPSPPTSRSGSRSSSNNGTSRFSAIARELGNELKARRVLGESRAHNVPTPAHNVPTPAPKRTNKSKPSEKDRIRALQSDPPRPRSAPARLDGDLTGITALMATPVKGEGFGTIDKNENVASGSSDLPQALSTLQARLRALETENSLSRRRIKELEDELERARDEVNAAKRQGEGRLKEVIGEKTALEDLIKSLRTHLARLTNELEQNKAVVADLRTAQEEAKRPPPHLSPLRGDSSVRKELIALRRQIERLGKEVHRLGGIVEEGLDTRRRARGERTIRMEQEEAAKLVEEIETDDDPDITRIRGDMAKRQQREKASSQQAVLPTPGPSRLRQGVHVAGSAQPGLLPPSVAPKHTARSHSERHRLTPPPSDEDDVSPTRSHGSRERAKPKRLPRMNGPSSPFPSIRAEDEEDFFAGLSETERPQPHAQIAPNAAQSRPSRKSETSEKERHDHGRTKSRLSEGDVPPQTILARVIRELEADFAHYKAIYSELADQYKVLDAASAIAKRRVLASHLKEVINTLEQKAEQITALYELLSYQDRPDAGQRTDDVKKSVPDILRMVKESLGEEGLRRLEEDGVGVRRRAAVV